MITFVDMILRLAIPLFLLIAEFECERYQKIIDELHEYAGVPEGETLRYFFINKISFVICLDMLMPPLNNSECSVERGGGARFFSLNSCHFQ